MSFIQCYDWNQCSFFSFFFFFYFLFYSPLFINLIFFIFHFHKSANNFAELRRPFQVDCSTNKLKWEQNEPDLIENWKKKENTEQERKKMNECCKIQKTMNIFLDRNIKKKKKYYTYIHKCYSYNTKMKWNICKLRVHKMLGWMFYHNVSSKTYMTMDQRSEISELAKWNYTILHLEQESNNNNICEELEGTAYFA